MAKSADRKTVIKKSVEIKERGRNIQTLRKGAQLQRAAICRALINQPDIIFGVEPTGALISKVDNKIMEMLRDLNETGTTSLLVTQKFQQKQSGILYMKE